MPVPLRSTAFPDVLDPRFAVLFNEEYAQEPDRIGDFYTVVTGGDSPTKDTYRMSQMGAFGDVPELTGSVVYDDVNEGYDTTLTHKEYASGLQIERKLFDDAQFGIIDDKPRGLAQAYARTRQKHAASIFNNAFSVDTTWQTGGDAVALCSDSHTTRAGGVSTAIGFDNLLTSSLTAVALQAARIQFRNFRDDRANIASFLPDGLLIPPDLEGDAFEITQSEGKPDTANNNANINRGRYKVSDWMYLNDVNNWFVYDSSLMKRFLKWVQRIDAEFAMVEDLDTIIGKWRLYARHSLGYGDWRWVLGSQVS